MTITKQQFHAYEAVRRSGLVNMYDPAVENLTGLSLEQSAFIRSNYSALAAEHGTDVDDERVEEIKSLTE